MLLFQNLPGKAVVLTDSKSSLFLILHRKPKVFAATVHNIHSNILKLIEKEWEVHFQWIPSHCNFGPNDTVDQAANLGRLLPNVTYRYLELVDLQRLVKCRQTVVWQLLWDVEKQGTFWDILKINWVTGTGVEVQPEPLM